jgi:hypothetical protein
MTAKMARSAPRPPFGVPGITAVVRAASLCCQKRRKSAKIHAGSGFIWRIPVYCFPELAKRAQAERPTPCRRANGSPSERTDLGAYRTAQSPMGLWPHPPWRQTFVSVWSWDLIQVNVGLGPSAEIAHPEVDKVRPSRINATGGPT